MYERCSFAWPMHWCTAAHGCHRWCLCNGNLCLIQEVTPRIEALEAALHGVDNLAGRAVALDAMADELGLDVPNLNIPAAAAEAAGESPDDAVRAAAGEARKGLEQGQQPRALKGLSMAMTDIKSDNDNLRRCVHQADVVSIGDTGLRCQVVGAATVSPISPRRSTAHWQHQSLPQQQCQGAVYQA